MIAVTKVTRDNQPIVDHFESLNFTLPDDDLDIVDAQADFATIKDA